MQGFTQINLNGTSHTTLQPFVLYLAKKLKMLTKDMSGIAGSLAVDEG